METCKLVKLRWNERAIEFMVVPGIANYYTNGEVLNNRYLVCTESSPWSPVQDVYYPGEQVRLINLHYVEYFDSIFLYKDIPTIELVGLTNDDLFRYKSLLY